MSHANETNVSLTVTCRVGKTPLNNKEQFISHHVHSHELDILEAAKAWHLIATESLAYFERNGGYRQ
jgi:hypothetical protein